MSDSRALVPVSGVKDLTPAQTEPGLRPKGRLIGFLMRTADPAESALPPITEQSQGLKAYHENASNMAKPAPITKGRSI